uniref:Large ribosomal subunit protein uL4c n=1 Tax=Pleonosporium borreri TaxID=2575635 RepID=A0A4D6X237_9FLOR|nr:ribosomal protein L4 [Pleonosporium borreri]
MIITKTIKYKIKQYTDNSISSSIPNNLDLKVHDNDKYNIYLIHKVLKWQLNQYRYRNASTKTRAQVRGGGKKPWKQKGTGRARSGSNKSPLWRGGGVIFGPQSQIYKSKINKKEKKLALHNALYNKHMQTFIINENLYSLNQPSTKSIINILQKLNISINKTNKVLLIVAKKEKNLLLSIRNLSNVDIIIVEHLNILALLKTDTILLTIDGFNKLKEIYND